METLNRREYETTEPQESNLTIGTSVEFPLYDASDSDQLTFAEMNHKLLEEFAWFIYLNKKRNVSLTYMGTELDISQYINTDLSKDVVEIIEGEAFNISIVVWNNNVSNSSKIYYLSEKGELVTARNTSFNKNTVDFYHAVFVSSKFFAPGMFLPYEDSGMQMAIEPSDNRRAIFNALKKKITTLVDGALKTFLILRADKHLIDMEKRGAMPNFSNDEYGQLRKADFETVTRELYCVEPRLFYKLNPKQEKSFMGFLNLLLSTDEREHLLQIIEEIVNLTADQRKTFAEILQRSKLDYIIEAINIIERRITVIEYLKNIVFDMTSFANERDHIQKIVEQHFWLFGEQYHLLTADKNLKTSLQEFESITEINVPQNTDIQNETEIMQRLDIFMYSQRVQENNKSEMLIIELKAPYVKLSLEVFNQVSRYANAIRKEPRFNAENRLWKFFAVCNTIDEDVAIKYENFVQHGKNRLVDIIGNFEIYALTWDDIFQAFEARHDFMLSKLKLDYSEVASTLRITDNLPISREKVDDISQRLVAINE